MASAGRLLGRTGTAGISPLVRRAGRRPGGGETVRSGRVRGVRPASASPRRRRTGALLSKRPSAWLRRRVDGADRDISAVYIHMCIYVVTTGKKKKKNWGRYRSYLSTFKVDMERTPGGGRGSRETVDDGTHVSGGGTPCGRAGGGPSTSRVARSVADRKPRWRRAGPRLTAVRIRPITIVTPPPPADGELDRFVSVVQFSHARRGRIILANSSKHSPRPGGGRTDGRTDGTTTSWTARAVQPRPFGPSLAPPSRVS